jgi:hypothetical protein
MKNSSDGRGRLRPLVSRLGLLLIALGAFLAAAGCGSVQVTDQTPTNASPSNVSPAPNTGEQHDLGIIGVDFDPALDVDRILANQPVSLVVGIENLGNRRESGVTVRAVLYNDDRTQVLMTDTKRITSLAAGDLTTVRFSRNEAPPRFNRYVLVVDVDAVNRENNTGNNHRILNIEIRGSH